jgi:hypothetical protein
MALSRSSFGKLTTTTPPKRGPHSQGLNNIYKKVKTVNAEKLNGRYRQVFTQRKANSNIT